MSNLDRAGIVFLALLFIAIVQAYRMAKYAKTDMGGDEELYWIIVKVLIPSWKPTLHGLTIQPLKYYYELLTGSLLIGIKKVTEALNEMPEDKFNDLNKGLDDVLKMAKYFVTPSIVLPTAAQSNNVDDYLIKVAVVCETLKTDVVAGNTDKHLTKQFLLFCKNNDLDVLEAHKSVVVLATKMERVYIKNLINEHKEQ